MLCGRFYIPLLLVTVARGSNVLRQPMTPDEYIEARETTFALYDALAQLPPTQARRCVPALSSRHEQGRNRAAEGVDRSRICCSVERGLDSDFLIDSAATSTEEIGNAIYPPMQSALEREGVPIGTHRARQLKSSDYAAYDVLIGMDEENMYYMY